MVKPFTKVLVGTDFGDWASRAVERAADVAQRYGAQLDALIERLRASHVEASSSLLSGVPWEQIVEAIASLGADLVVVGTHGRTGLRRALLGSVASGDSTASRLPHLRGEYTTRPPATRSSRSADRGGPPVGGVIRWVPLAPRGTIVEGPSRPSSIGRDSR